LDHVEETPTRFNFKRDVVTHFWVPAQKEENIEKIKKIFERNKKNSSEKMMPERSENS
jgi:hypothetical protein